MGDDLTSLIIYLALAIIGVIASAAKNKRKQQQEQQNRTGKGQVPRSFPADPAKDYDPELGPLIELFEIPKPRKETREFESVEDGPSVEEQGMFTDSPKASDEFSGLDRPVSEVEVPASDVQSFEEGQSDIQKMIARYEAIRKELQDDNSLGDDIASGEIVSVEAEEKARIKKQGEKQKFDARTAIIYSEILKRKEY